MQRYSDYARRKDRKYDKRKRRQKSYEAPSPQEPRFVKPAPIQALTPRQGDLIESINTEDLTVVMGPAGTGKTYVAAALAADMLAAGEVTKLILCRPAVGADEEHGFLPGDIGKKLAPWVVPFTEVIEQRLGKQRFASLMSAGAIEVVPFAYMRGRTFSGAFIILDEAQNTTYAQIKMFLTRIGEDSITVVNGDVEQTDLDAESGLATILGMIDRQRLPIPVIAFTPADVVRSGMCRIWTEAFIKHEKIAA